MQYRTSNDLTIIQQHAVMYIPNRCCTFIPSQMKEAGNAYERSRLPFSIADSK